MTIRELIDSGVFELVHEGSDTERSVSKVFCCDLLSIAMGRGVADAAWVTVMGNINTLAVLSLTDMALIVLAEGAAMDEAGMNKAREQGFTILRTDLPIFDAGLIIHNMLNPA